MTPQNKRRSEVCVDSMAASGGTSIYAGMKSAADILTARTTKNPLSCVFLLTDGIDRGMTQEKKVCQYFVRITYYS